MPYAWSEQDLQHEQAELAVFSEIRRQIETDSELLWRTAEGIQQLTETMNDLRSEIREEKEKTQQVIEIQRSRLQQANAVAVKMLRLRQQV